MLENKNKYIIQERDPVIKLDLVKTNTSYKHKQAKQKSQGTGLHYTKQLQTT